MHMDATLSDTMDTTSRFRSLKLIRDRSELEGTCYFEFLGSPTREQPRCWSDRSLYLEDDGFDFINGPFVRALPDFDYYGFNCFNSEDIGRVLTELDNWRDAVAQSTDCSILSQTFLGCFNQDCWARYPWPDLRHRVCEVTSGVRDFILEQSREFTYLWVLGI